MQPTLTHVSLATAVVTAGFYPAAILPLIIVLTITSVETVSLLANVEV